MFWLVVRTAVNSFSKWWTKRKTSHPKYQAFFILCLLFRYFSQSFYSLFMQSKVTKLVKPIFLRIFFPFIIVCFHKNLTKPHIDIFWEEYGVYCSKFKYLPFRSIAKILVYVETFNISLFGRYGTYWYPLSLQFIKLKRTFFYFFVYIKSEKTAHWCVFLKIDKRSCAYFLKSKHLPFRLHRQFVCCIRYWSSYLISKFI